MKTTTTTNRPTWDVITDKDTLIESIENHIVENPLLDVKTLQLLEESIKLLRK